MLVNSFDFFVIYKDSEGMIMKIGEEIKKYRMKRNITQQEMAYALAITPQAIARWEKGWSLPDISMIPEIVEYLGISADVLLGCKSSVENYDDDGYISLLNQEQVDCIFDYYATNKQRSKKKKIVLVVDDVPFMRRMLNDIISHEGHKVIEVASGEECLDFIQKEKVDVCTLDINLSGINGIETLEKVKKINSKINVIMLSAQSTKENVNRSHELGADAFVVKPFQESSLLVRI